MGRPREPINLIEAKGRSAFSKAEKERRAASEVHGCTDEIVAPSYLTTKQKKHFEKLADQLEKIKIMGETDCETLARYVVAEELYESATKKLSAAMRSAADLDEIEKLSKLQDRLYKQASALARDLGLTISSRCKLQVPVKEEPEKPVNKFAKFGVG